MLWGEITQVNQPVIDHGFVLSQYAQFPSTSSAIFRLGATSAKGKFQAKVEVELAAGVKYYVKAFAKTAEFTSYGSPREFVSLGSKAPQLASITPARGIWKDVVVLKGTNFSKVKSNLIVKFDSKVASVISSSTDSIVCQVPHELNVSPATVQVSVFGNSTELKDAFTLLPPEIDSIDPVEGNIGTSVTVTGKNFSANTLKVTLGDMPVTVKDISPTSIVFEVPRGIQGPTKVKIVTAQGNGSAEADFTALTPSVTNVAPLSGTYNDLITITVENWLHDQQVLLLFGSSSASPVAQTSNTLTFHVPESIESYQYDLQVQLGDMVIPTGKSFTLTPPEIYSVEPSLVLSRYITIKGKGFSLYNLDVQIDGHSADIYSSDHETINILVPQIESHLASVSVTSSGRSLYAPEKIKIPFGQLSVYAPNASSLFHYFSIGDQLYLTGEYQWNYYLYKFDRLNASWVVVEHLPFAAAWGDYSFTIGETVYYYSTAGSTFWAYNSVTGITQLKDVPFDAHQPSTYAVNDFGYVVGGYDAAVNPLNKVWQYNPAIDEWQERSGSGQSFMQLQGFVMNDICYAFLDGGQLAAYNPENDQWTITSHVFDFYSYQFIGCQKGKLYFRQPWGELIEYSLQTSSYKHYGEQGFLEEVVSERRFSTSAYLYYLNNANQLWEFDSDFLN